MSTNWTAQSVLEMARSFQLSQPLLAAAELRLFEALGSAPRTAAETAGLLHADPRATEILLNALAALGLLHKAQDAYRLPDALVPLLAGSSETSIAAMLRHTAHCAHQWDKLVEVARAGHPTGALEDMLGSDDKCGSFIEAMHVIGRHLADDTVSAIRPQRFTRLLDVGGASGTYTLSFLRQAPLLRVTLFDLPPVVEMARRRLTAAGVMDRVTLAAGDFYKDPLPPGHDLVLLSAIIHQNSPAQNRALYAKCHDALVSGGMIVIRDFVMDELRTCPVGGALFAVNMLVNTEGGNTYSLSEIKADLESAGFGDVGLARPAASMDALVMARRP